MDSKDPKKPSDEEIQKLLEQLKKNQSGKSTALSFGFLLHRNYVVHMTFSLLINFLISAVVIGLAIGVKAPLLEIEIIGYALGIILLTLIENFVKILMFKYFMRAMILSMGILSVLTQILILYAVDVMIVTGFHFPGIQELIIFSLLFSGLRFMVSIYVRRRIYTKKIRFLEGK